MMVKYQNTELYEDPKLVYISDAVALSDTERERFDRVMLVNKEDILNQLVIASKDLERAINYEELCRIKSHCEVFSYTEWQQQMIQHSEQFYTALGELINRFQAAIERDKLFQHLEPFWCYSIHIGSVGACLRLNYCSSVEIDWEMTRQTMDTSYELINVPTRRLKTGEYAAIYNVEPNTVRMWIRRGKIRTAIKSGREWLIPELTDKPERGFRPASYRWGDANLENLPEDLSYLKNHTRLEIRQDRYNKETFTTELYNNSWDVNHQIKQLSSAQRAQLEMYLISNPQVRYVDGNFIDIYRKRDG